MFSVPRPLTEAQHAGSLSALSDLFHDLSVLGTLDAEGFARYLMDAMGYGAWAAAHLGNREAVEAVRSMILSASTSFRDPEKFPFTSAIQGNPRQRYSASTTMQQFPGISLRIGNQDPVRQEVIR